MIDLEARVRQLESELTRIKTRNRKKLTGTEVREIRRFKRTACLTNTELAAMYSVHRSTVARIISGTYHKDA